MPPEWYAMEQLEETIQETKEFLLPFSLGTWARVALIVFFVGGSSVSFLSFPGTTFGEDLEQGAEEIDDRFTEESDILNSTVVLSVLFVITGFVLVFSYLSAVFEFIFYQSLEDGSPKIRSGFRKHAFNGLKYYGFNLLIAIFSIGMVVALFSMLFAGLSVGFLPLIGLIALMVPLGIFISLLRFFVKNMVLPEMVSEDSGFIEAIKDNYGYVATEWKQVGIFYIFKLFLNMLASFVTATVLTPILLILMLPLGAMIIFGLLISPIMFVIALIISLAVSIAVWLGVSVPVQSYVYQWVFNVQRQFSS